MEFDGALLSNFRFRRTRWRRRGGVRRIRLYCLDNELYSIILLLRFMGGWNRFKLLMSVQHEAEEEEYNGSGWPINLCKLFIAQFYTSRSIQLQIYSEFSVD